MRTAPALERLLRRERTITLAALAVLCALTWAYLAAGAGFGMGGSGAAGFALFPRQPGTGAMTGMAMADPTARWNPADWALALAMWWTMMIAMMTPSATPAILLYARVHRHAVHGPPTANGSLAPTWIFIAGYFLAWLGFSILAATLQQALQQAGLLSSTTLRVQPAWLSGAVLLATGLYQLSALKQACLSHCRAPAVFLTRHWRPRARGALRLGLLHGGYCLGCCWLLMALLFIGGVMNLAWIAALSLLVLAEKHLPAGRLLGRAVGVVLVLWGLAILLIRGH